MNRASTEPGAVHSATAHPFLTDLGQRGRLEVDSEWVLPDAAGEMTVRVQSIGTSYRTFVLLSVPTKDRFVARHRRRPRIVA